MFIITLITLYTSRVVLKVLGIDDFGIYNVAGGLISFLSILTSSMTNATQRFLNIRIGVGDIRGLNYDMNVSIKLHHIVSFIIIILGETVGLIVFLHYLNFPPERQTAAFWVYQSSLLTLFFTVLRVPFNSLLIAYERFTFVAWFGIIDVFLKLIFVILLQFIHYDKLIIYAISFCFLSFVQYYLFRFKCQSFYNSIRISYVSLFKSNESLAILKFSIWNILGNLGTTSANQGIGLIFNLFYQLAVNGALGITNQITNTLANFMSTVQQAFRPQLIQSYTEDDKYNFNALIGMCARWSFFVLAFLSIPLFINIDYILSLWLGQLPEYSSIFIKILTCFLIIDSFSQSLLFGIEAQGNIKKYQIINFFLMFSNVFLAYLLCKLSFTPSVALISRVIINLCVFLLRLFYLHRTVNGFDLCFFITKSLFPIIVISIVSLGFVEYYSKEENSISFLLTTSINYWITLAVAVYIIGLDAKEKALVKRILKFKKHD